MYSALRFYHCANIPASTVPSHVPRSHGSALRFRSFQLRFTAQAAAVLPLSPGSLNSVSQHDTDKVFFSFIADFLQGFLDLNANIIRHSCDLVFHLLRYHFVQRFAKNIGVPYTIRCVSQIVFKALDQIL